MSTFYNSIAKSHSSPQRRGTARHRPLQLGECTFISAWYGEPRPDRQRQSSYRVYPRVGGGAGSTLALTAGGEGLSPRGRGSPVGDRGRAEDEGSIPAWAGEPLMMTAITSPGRVYPRVGGRARPTSASASPMKGLSPRGRGSPCRTAALGRMSGVYPRVGGGAAAAPVDLVTMAGLSPRGRGSQRAKRSEEFAKGSIPAWAGEPSSVSRFWSSARVYPRVGGGATLKGEGERGRWGLSPRGRGSPAEESFHRVPVGSIPAWAGEP